MNTPDLTKKVLGFRRFHLGVSPTYDPWSLPPTSEHWRLHSTAVKSSFWEPGVNTAVCRRETFGAAHVHAHAAPSHTCECGFYSMHTINHIDRYVPRTVYSVLAAVVSWGVLECQYGGLRAQHSQVVLLAPEEGAQPRKVLVEAAMRYGVKIVPAQALEREAARFGEGVPASFIPEDPESPFGFVMPTYWRLPVITTGELVAQITASFSVLAQAAIPSKEAADALRNAMTKGIEGDG